MSTQTKSVADLQKITGLKAEYAKECFDAFGGYAPALASFAQSYASLPPTHFDAHDAAAKNTKAINEELRAIYSRAREMKAKSGKQDEEVWRSYHQSEAATAALSSPSPAAAASHSAAAAAKPSFGFGSAAPSTNAKPAFGFGSTTPATTATPSFTFGSAVLTKEAKDAKPSFGFGSSAAATEAKPTFAFGATAAAKETKGAKPNFGFGAATTAADAKPSFGFGAAPSTAAASASTAFPGFGAQPAATTAEEAAPVVEKKPVQYCEPTHFTGPYFDMPDFWETEVVARAPLLNLNNGFLEANKDTLRPRLEKWLAKAGFYNKPVKYVVMEDEDEEVVRVIIKDADRTFFEPPHRQKMVAFLNAMFNEFGAYGQAMSYLAGLCMLVLNEQETATVLRFVATEYIRGHWAAEAVGFATSAWVVEFFMKKLYPDVAKHLQTLNLWPDTYLQKILTGLCIHVLPFADLFDFLDAFMAGGMRYLIRFCLAIVEHFRAEIMAIKSSTEANKLYELMRLDAHVVTHADIRAILERAPSVDLGDDGASLDLIRSQVYGEKVEPRLKRAPKTIAFEPCVECEKNRPTWYTDDLGPVCESCKNAHPEFTYEKY